MLVLGVVLIAVPSLPSSDAVAVRKVFRLPFENVRLRVVISAVSLYVLGHFRDSSSASTNTHEMSPHNNERKQVT